MPINTEVENQQADGKAVLTSHNPQIDPKSSGDGLMLRTQILQAIAELTKEMLEHQPLQPLLELITQQLLVLTGATSTFVHLVTADNQQLELVCRGGEEIAPLGQMLSSGSGLAGKSWESHRAEYIENYDSYNNRVNLNSGIRQACALPMFNGTNVIGVLGIMFTTNEESIADQLDRLKQYTNLASLAIQNARLIAQTRHELDMSHTLSQLTEKIAGSQSTDELLEISVAGLMQLFEPNTIDIWSMSNDRLDKLLNGCLSDDSGTRELEPSDEKSLLSTLNTVFESDNSLSRTLSSLRFISTSYFEANFSPAHWYTFILLDGGEAYRLLRVTLDRTLSPSEENLLRSIVGHISMAGRVHIMLELATRKAEHDQLTELLNRQAFENKLNETIEAGVNPDYPYFAVLFIDLDGFKHINDTQGHAAGDEILVHVSARFKSALEDRGVLARFGGDEFAVFMEAADESECRLITDELLKSLEGPFPFPVTLGASIGIVHDCTREHCASGLILQADQAMYHAKRNGKNQYKLVDDVPQDSSMIGFKNQQQWSSA